MRRSILLKILGSVAFLLVLGLGPELSTAQTGPLAVPLTIIITRVQDIHTSGEGFDVGSNPPDWYMTVTVDGETTQVGPIIDDMGDISPNWTFTFAMPIPVSKTTADVSLYLRDHDAPADPNGDDVADIDPRPNDRTIEFTVDMVTGRWIGEVNFPKRCSAGGAGDDTAYVCWDVSVLSRNGDADGDGIPDGWEMNGVDLNDNGVIDPWENLPAMGANPHRKDLFIEVDCMVNDANSNSSLADPVDHSHCPLAAAIGDVVQAFANAPVGNLDGTSGIQLHVDVGPLYGAGNVTTVPRTGGGAVGSYGDFGGGGSLIPEEGNAIIDYDGAAGNPGTNFYSLKGSPGNFFNATRASVFRYMIFGHQTNFRRAANDCTSGQAEGIPGNDFYGTLGGTNAAGQPCWATDANGFSVGSRAQQAGTFMHELGHVLGLLHGGGNDINNKPNYLSVMNYNWQPCTVPASVAAGVPGACDYSRIGPASTGGMSDLVETGLDECVGIGGGLGFGGVDWNGNALQEGATCMPPNNANVVADTNNDGVCAQPGLNNNLDSAPGGDDAIANGVIADGRNRICNTTAAGDDVQATPVGSTPPQPNTLQSFNDWGNIVYVFQTLPNFANGVASPVPDEPDPDTIAQAQAHLSTLTEPILVIVDTAPATILPGQTLTWTIETSNIGNGPALQASLVDTLPDDSQVSFALDTVVLGTTVTHTAQFVVPADACPNDLVNTAHASYQDLAGKGYTADASATTRVIDIVPPNLTVSLSPTVLAPPNHNLVPITASITVSDNCDPNPVVRLVSIVSNEPDNGLGDGDTRNDIQGAALGTDDRRFQVRAERSGTGTGRVYTITYEAEDASGNKTMRQSVITVPRNQ